VGGYAMMLYTEPRFTKSIGIWIDTSPENSGRVYVALSRFGAPLDGVSASYFSQAGMVYQIGVPPVRVDILMSVDGLEFASAWEKRSETAFGGLTVPCLGREDLIRNKRATGRPRDLLDAEELERSGIDRSRRPAG